MSKDVLFDISERGCRYEKFFCSYTIAQYCFNYFAVTKLMFERLGIPNIDVKKVKNYEGDSNHYWSLVSVDGGETYYHFDAAPPQGRG